MVYNLILQPSHFTWEKLNFEKQRRSLAVVILNSKPFRIVWLSITISEIGLWTCGYKYSRFKNEHLYTIGFLTKFSSHMLQDFDGEKHDNLGENLMKIGWIVSEIFIVFSDFPTDPVSTGKIRSKLCGNLRSCSKLSIDPSTFIIIFKQLSN